MCSFDNSRTLSNTNKDELDESDLLSHIDSDKGVLEKGG